MADAPGGNLPAVRRESRPARPSQPDYLSEAFYNQYNLITLAGLFALGCLLPGVWWLGAAAELAYLATVPQNERFQRMVRSEHNKAQLREVAARPADLKEKLTPPGRERYAALESVVKSLGDYTDQVDPSSLVLLEGSISKLDYLLLGFLRLLYASEQLQGYLKSVDRSSIRRSIERLETQVELEKSDRIRKVKKRNLDILNARIRRLNRALDEQEFMEANLDATEDTVRLIRDRVLSSGTLAHAMDDLDMVLSDLRDGERHLEEMDTILDREKNSFTSEIRELDLSDMKLPDLGLEEEEESTSGGRERAG